MKGTSGFPVRIRYTKHGKIRWISHRDVARALERAFRITELPLAFTEGFSPHPKVSFGLALSTGHESDGEYLDLEFTRPVGLEALPALLTDALPSGMAVTGVAALVERAPALQEAVTAVEWLVELDSTGVPGPDPDELRRLVDAAIASPALLASRRRKGRDVVEDVRPVIRRLEVRADTPPTVWMELYTQPRSAKPGEVLAAIGGDLREGRAVRTRQWIERDGARCEPLGADTRPTREGIDAGVGTPRGLGAGAGAGRAERLAGGERRGAAQEAAAGVAGRTEA